MSWYYNSYPKRKSADELKALAVKNTKKDYRPIVIEGRKISNTWWGAAWCDNIDRYADAYNRLSRGRSYARSGCVIDLKIEGGTISAKVQGSRSAPYDVKIVISPIRKENLEAIMDVCQGSLESIAQLESGSFPEEYKSLFTAQGKGLFPTMKEIRFTCSCPDSARLCKHIAAVLYAIGRRLDDNPLLFLSMRGIDVEDFSRRIVKQEVARIFSSSTKGIDKARLIEEKDAAFLFGYEEYKGEDVELDVKRIFGL